jgi:hypothetical protein
MAILAPHGIADLQLAPVVIAYDRQIQELARLNVHRLADRVEIESNRVGLTREQRQDDLLDTVGRCIDRHGWQTSWDTRGIRLSHGRYSVVLGVPETFHAYVAAR